MYKKMLIPLDGSELAEVVLVYAIELTSRLGLEVILFHVYSPEEVELLPMRRTYIDKKVETMRRQLETQTKTGPKPISEKVEVHGELAEGYPAEEIIRYADDKGIDIILMGTHGRSGINRWAMGSVADKVLRASKVPIWLVRAGIPPETVLNKWPMRKVLVLLDGSELAESVLPHVEALAKQRGTEFIDVTLLEVLEPIPPAVYYFNYTVPIDWGDIIDRSEKEVEKYLARTEKRLKDAGLKVQSEFLMGKPAETIVDYVNKNPVNLVVMSTHGRSGLSRWVLGSVAEKVLLGVSSPIFLVGAH
jgi:nucleotide-binding universal stress UspA family protein